MLDTGNDGCNDGTGANDGAGAASMVLTRNKMVAITTVR